MPSASKLYAGSYLTAVELTPLGQRRTAVVHAAVEEIVGQEIKPQLVLDLVAGNGQPWPKRLVLNKTNMLQMVAAFGDDYLAWPGHRIAVWADNVMFNGRVVPGIKVQAAPPGGAAAAAVAVPPPPPPPPARPNGQMPPPAPLPAAAAEPASLPPSDAELLDDEIPF